MHRDASTENGVIVTRCNRWPLMIDPQGQANKWVRRMEESNGLKVIDLKMKNFLLAVENAITYGTPILLQDVLEELTQAKALYEEGESLAEALPASDVLYVTRVQRERFANPDDYDKVKGSYVIDKAAMGSAKPDMMVLHPLPRVDEIATDVDADPRAKYFEQMENGMYVRMAILALVLGADLTTL